MFTVWVPRFVLRRAAARARAKEEKEEKEEKKKEKEEKILRKNGKALILKNQMQERMFVLDTRLAVETTDPVYREMWAASRQECSDWLDRWAILYPHLSKPGEPSGSSG